MTTCELRPGDSTLTALANPRRAILFGIALAIVLFTRLYDLSAKTMMHDELLFANYTYYNLFQDWNYAYAPILHGPIMLHFQNLVFHVFGATNYTVRLGVAILGIASFFLLWEMRRWLREPGIWFVLFFYALSPGITFFQRFFHQDAMYVFCTLWIVVSLGNWWRTHGSIYAASAIIGSAALLCNKASALFVYFTIATFVLLLIIHDVTAYFLDGKANHIPDFLLKVPRPPQAIWATIAAGTFITLCLTQIFEGLSYDGDVKTKLGHDWVLHGVRSIPQALGWTTGDADAGELAGGRFWRLFYVGAFAGLFIAFAATRVAVTHRIGRTEFLTRAWRRVHEARFHIVGALAAGLAMYVLIYTTFFFNPIGVFDIYGRTWSYWGGQHEWGRIGGPFHQHMLNIALYETPALLIVLIAWFRGLFRVPATRNLSVAFILMLVAVAGSQKLLFSGVQIMAAGATVPHDVNVWYLKNIFFGGLVAAALLLFFPKCARIVTPASFLVLVAYSVFYFNSAQWNELLGSTIYKHGEAVMLLGAKVTFEQFMEIKFNFDAGWNLALVLMLIFFAVLYTWQALERGDRFHAFLVWWTVTMVGSASYAREGVPQVGIHAMLPVIVLAGSYVTRFAREMHRYPIRKLSYAALVPMVLWSAKSTINLNFRMPDEPRERMAYGPASRDVLADMNFIRQYYSIASIKVNDKGQASYTAEPNARGKIKDVRIFMKPIDQVTWPAKWYLRDIDYTEGPDPANAVKEGWDFIFIAVEDKDKYPGLEEKYHVMRGRGTTFWTPSPISPVSLSNVWEQAIPGHYLDGTGEATEAFNSLADWNRVWRYLMHREYFDGTGRAYPSVSSFEYLFCFRKDLY
ncbi:hypothetical protein BH09SUM1_BH09SUM1_05660 [soil metagenome]